jgi:hypothetical protein
MAVEAELVIINAPFGPVPRALMLVIVISIMVLVRMIMLLF